ncbi:hypothetical protein [Chthonobacter rhizosphaerae]|uniref:hypothetical protein n=1 Tax=Chthonobacter rhizosphaerae TaxID=2735553 RepID=UPI0015EE9F9B|nr:hypothetical protein [Chthonobacter rhizosphaerae]
MNTRRASSRSSRSPRQPANVAGAQDLVRLLDQAGLTPQAALWVYREETDSWRLWLAPPPHAEERTGYYKAVSGVLATPEGKATRIDFGDVQYVAPKDDVLRGLADTVSAARIAAIKVGASVVNGIYHPDSIIIRLAV